MTPRPLSPDLTEALHAAGDEPLLVFDPTNQHHYVVVDSDIHRRAMSALRRQETVESIKRGLDGPAMTLEESRQRNLEALREHHRQ